MKNFVLPAVLIAAISCTVQESLEQPFESCEFCSIMEEEVRTSLSGGSSVRWEAGDQIDILGASTNTCGTVCSIADGGSRAVLRAAGVYSSDKELYAFYPHRSGGDFPCLSESGFELSIPARQDGSFACANVSVARLEGGSTFRFRNAGAVLQFCIQDRTLAASVAKIELSARAGEHVAGRIRTDMATLQDRFPSQSSRVTTLVPSKIVAGEPLYAAVLPRSYSAGLMLRFYDSSGKLVRSFGCPAVMDLARSTLVNLGSVSSSPSSGGADFYESFNACKGVGGNDNVFRSYNPDPLITRSNASAYCDNEGWDFHYVAPASGCVQFTPPEDSNAWILSPPLGISGSATVNMRSSYFYGSYFGLEFRVVGEGRASVQGRRNMPWLYTFSGMEYNKMYDMTDIWLSGLTPDSRLLICTSYPSRNHSYLDEIRVSPGAPDFSYLILENTKLLFPPEGGRITVYADASSDVGACTTSASVFVDYDTSADLRVDGMTEAPSVYYMSASGSTPPRVLVIVGENRTGHKRKSHASVYGQGGFASLDITQETW